MSNQPLYKSEVFWVAVAAIASAVASVVSLITVLAAISSWEEERLLKRPYFSILDQSINEKVNAHVLSFSLKNVGVHAAESPKLKICWMGSDVSKPPKCEEHEMPMAIPGQSKPTPEAITFYVEGPIQFLGLGVRYKHALLDEHYSQSFFVKVVPKEGDRAPFLLHVSKQERNRILSYFEEVLREFL